MNATQYEIDTAQAVLQLKEQYQDPPDKFALKIRASLFGLQETPFILALCELAHNPESLVRVCKDVIAKARATRYK